jgi:translation initiation factor 5A
MAEVEVIKGSVGDLKVGKYVMIDGEPCRVVGIQTSKPGKHGAAKARVDGIGLFDGVKHTLLKPTDADVDIPLIERKRAQIVSVAPGSAQLMDLESFETFEVTVPGEMSAEVQPGKEMQYISTMGKKILLQVSGER